MAEDTANLYVQHFNIMQEYKKKYGDIILEYKYEELEWGQISDMEII